MTATGKEARDEFFSFLREFDLSDVTQDSRLKAHIFKSFKHYYPLLIMEEGLLSHSPWNSEEKTKLFHEYFKECISDICQSIILSSAGFYKASLLCLRSGLENWFRCIGISADQNVLSLKSVFELIDVVKSINIIENNKYGSVYFSTLRQRYKTLCAHVHTANTAHMALVIAAGAYPRYLHEDADKSFSAIDEVCSRIIALVCLIAEPTFRKLHHRHYDLVCDSLPRNLKAHLNG